MEKQTVISRITASIDFSQEAIMWMDSLRRNLDTERQSNLWFIRDHGQNFLSEYQSYFGQILVEEINSEIQSYFREIGLAEAMLPQARVTETYIGSLTLATIVYISSTIGGTYAALKSVSEIPEMIDGFTRLKNSIANKFKRKSNVKVQGLLNEQAKRNNLPAPPQNILDLKDFVIDARPLSALKPSEMKSHSIHLQAGISQDAFTLENLGDEPMRDIQIGLFIGQSKRNQWSFAESFSGSIGLLFAKQTISKELLDFVHHSSGKLQINSLPVHIDCWVQDSHGIYLFNFYLDK